MNSRSPELPDFWRLKQPQSAGLQIIKIKCPAGIQCPPVRRERLVEENLQARPLLVPGRIRLGRRRRVFRLGAADPEVQMIVIEILHFVNHRSGAALLAPTDLL